VVTSCRSGEDNHDHGILNAPKFPLDSKDHDIACHQALKGIFVLAKQTYVGMETMSDAQVKLWGLLMHAGARIMEYGQISSNKAICGECTMSVL
jgi:hypothetical protein